MRVLTITLIAGLILWTGFQLNAAEDATAALEKAAETVESAEITPHLDTGDTAWLIVSTALVMMMTPAGLALFYGGMSRYKNLLNTLAMTFVSYCLASVVWMMWGYTLAFGSSMGGLVGDLNHFFLGGIGVNSVTGTIPTFVFVLFYQKILYR